ncbi:TrkH family potassium uptake protein [Fictibacillus phosphorivorans]|uniref:TrkH family potassium uptake protein n=1 Tax=Fictibacillus phosphorivorans TaxID=1221500 RepID=UPI00203F570D|nr:TrkH family potassium uptake protein [Fictibacillus phosphorivorans]MCM3717537.1 TrkH family potassium uptake protein [Fictibacillus phosphorivorans]MCM3775232.1 TrkH family potassium uptake protein [Fictibacillus phosphorivorans]
MFKKNFGSTQQKKNHLTSVQLIVIFYLLSIIVATILLGLPIGHEEGVKLSFIDTLFTAVSAVSVTGLTAVNIQETFNHTGTIILAIVVQIGGIGVMTLGTAIWLLIGKRIGMRERQLIMTDQNQSTLAGLVQLMKQILSLIIGIEIVGTILFFILFQPYYDTDLDVLYHAFFASVTATTNAGFDITGNSLIPFRHDYLVQIVTMFLISAGAIGFPVLIEINNFIKERKYLERYTFTLFTKVTTITFALLVVTGALGIYLLEMHAFLEDKSWHETFFYSMFQSVTTRSGGLSTMNVSEFSVPTLLYLGVMMFIGASPSSVGGGIRTTTFAVAALAIFFYAKGRNTIKIFNREIYPEDIQKSFIVIIVAMGLCTLSTIIMSITDPLPIEEIFFEVCSAFGTTGLSTGITGNLSSTGKVILMILMFIGRIGVLSFLFIIRGKAVTENIHYPKEKLIIGQ